MTEPQALAQSPAFEMPARNGPWLRLNWWAEGLERANCYLEWTTQKEPEFGLDRRLLRQGPKRGTMQGGNVPGGLGLDKEFFESVLVPQVMLYGFLGFEPTPGGFKVHPRLPQDWPELKITRLHLHDLVMDLTVKANGTIALHTDEPSTSPMVVELPKGSWQTAAPGAQVEGQRVTFQPPVGSFEIAPVK